MLQTPLCVYYTLLMINILIFCMSGVEELSFCEDVIVRKNRNTKSDTESIFYDRE
jgi:hypothetical protein